MQSQSRMPQRRQRLRRSKVKWHASAGNGGERRTSQRSDGYPQHGRPALAAQQAARKSSENRLHSADKLRKTSWLSRAKRYLSYGLLIVAAVCYVKFPVAIYAQSGGGAHPVGVRIHLQSFKINCPKPTGMNPRLCHGPIR